MTKPVNYSVDMDIEKLFEAIDLWFEKVVAKRLKGFAKLTFYGVDLVAAFQSRSESEAFGITSESALRTKRRRFKRCLLNKNEKMRFV